ncbi:MAG: hypothetical protein MUC36_21860 [Planctomycetes bacterium]|nr:hypothetical protein [Planctomycetota bacterium]
MISFAATLSLALLAPALRAQFPGDVYLQRPASVVATGGTLAVDVLTFTGTQRFGAARFEVAFDPTVLRFTGGASPTHGPLLTSVQQSRGRLGVVVTNAKGVDNPFGVVKLTQLQFVAIGAPGSTSPLDLTARGAIALNGNSTPSAASDGSVLVTTAAAQSAAAMLEGTTAPPAPLCVQPEQPLVPTAEEIVAAQNMGRPGQEVPLWRMVPHATGVAAAPLLVMLPAAEAGDAARQRRTR